MKFTEVYPWNVIDFIGAGRQIYCTDRKKKEVFLLNTSSAAKVVEIIKNDANLSSYEFWFEDEE